MNELTCRKTYKQEGKVTVKKDKESKQERERKEKRKNKRYEKVKR